VIVVREKDAWQAADGGWLRAYAFADGHAEIHKAADGNFQPWEAQHIIIAPQNDRQTGQ
jgi:prepilin-type processing-associated H-X9-DG protein